MTRLFLAADAAIDLHLHTLYSDGKWTPEALLDHLVREGFALAVISDHDRVDTIASNQALAGERGLSLVPAAEMTCTWMGEMVDLLCYGFDPSGGALAAVAADVLQRQQENTRMVVEAVRKQGCAISDEELESLLATPSSAQPFAIVDALKAHGVGLGEPSAGRIIAGAGCAFAMSQPSAVAEAAHRDGGLSVLAHPGHGDGFVDFTEALLDEFRQETAIDGLEVYHPIHSAEKVELYRSYAEKNGLLVSAGSDSHKPEKPPVKYRAELCRELLGRLGIEIYNQ